MKEVSVEPRRVFGWHTSVPGCAYYRVQLPLRTLGETAGWHTACGQKLPLTPELRAALEARKGTAAADVAAFLAERYDVIVGQQIGAGGTGADAVWAALAHRRDRGGGPMLVLETDDDLMALHGGHDQDARAKLEARADTYRRAIELADRVTCTTPALAETLSKFNDDVRVIPNYIDRAMLAADGPGTHLPPAPRLRAAGYGGAAAGLLDGVQMGHTPGWPGPEQMLIGWGGSPTHRNDFALCWPGLRRLLLQRRDVAFLSMAVRWHVDDPAVGRLIERQQMAGLSWMDMERTPWPAYWERIGHLDIGLAPLDKNAFNESKSWIKILEYAAMGVPFVASPSPEYQRFWEVGQNQLGQHRPDSFSMLVNSEHGWYGALRAMTEDWDNLRRMQIRARIYARQFTIQEHIGLWASALGE